MQHIYQLQFATHIDFSLLRWTHLNLLIAAISVLVIQSYLQQLSYILGVLKDMHNRVGMLYDSQYVTSISYCELGFNGDSDLVVKRELHLEITNTNLY